MQSVTLSWAECLRTGNITPPPRLLVGQLEPKGRPARAANSVQTEARVSVVVLSCVSHLSFLTSVLLNNCREAAVYEGPDPAEGQLPVNGPAEEQYGIWLHDHRGG